MAHKACGNSEIIYPRKWMGGVADLEQSEIIFGNRTRKNSKRSRTSGPAWGPMARKNVGVEVFHASHGAENYAHGFIANWPEGPFEKAGADIFISPQVFPVIIRSNGFCCR